MAANNGSIKLVAGNSNRALSEAIGAYLQTPLAKADVRRFADMEVFVEIKENVRGADVFVLQSTSFPANDHLMELPCRSFFKSEIERLAALNHQRGTRGIATCSGAAVNVRRNAIRSSFSN